MDMNYGVRFFQPTSIGGIESRKNEFYLKDRASSSKKRAYGVSHKPLKYMVVVRLNNYSINLLKLQHKINLKFLDTNKNTNNFFGCPTGGVIPFI